MKEKGAATTALLACVVLLGGCLPEDVAPGHLASPGGEEGSYPVFSLPFETVDQGLWSGIREPRELVIRDFTTWQRLWEEHTAGRVPAPPLPDVDFTSEMIIAFFLGGKPSSGFTATITQAIVRGDGLVVRVEVGSPPPRVPVFQVLTWPFHIVRLLRYDLPVEFDVLPAPLKSGSARLHD